MYWRSLQRVDLTIIDLSSTNNKTLLVVLFYKSPPPGGLFVLIGMSGSFFIICSWQLQVCLQGVAHPAYTFIFLIQLITWLFSIVQTSLKSKNFEWFSGNAKANLF